MSTNNIILVVLCLSFVLLITVGVVVKRAEDSRKEASTFQQESSMFDNTPEAPPTPNNSAPPTATLPGGDALVPSEPSESLGVTVLSPTEGDQFCMGDTVPIRWTAPRGADIVFVALNWPSAATPIVELPGNRDVANDVVSYAYDWNQRDRSGAQMQERYVYSVQISVNMKDGTTVTGNGGLFALINCRRPFDSSIPDASFQPRPAAYTPPPGPHSSSLASEGPSTIIISSPPSGAGFCKGGTIPIKWSVPNYQGHSSSLIVIRASAKTMMEAVTLGKFERPDKIEDGRAHYSFDWDQKNFEGQQLPRASDYVIGVDYRQWVSGLEFLVFDNATFALRDCE